MGVLPAICAKSSKAIGLCDIFARRQRLSHGHTPQATPGAPREPPPTVKCFIAHLDTSPDMSGRHVSPRIVENYGGGDIWLAILQMA